MPSPRSILVLTAFFLALTGCTSNPTPSQASDTSAASVAAGFTADDGAFLSALGAGRSTLSKEQAVASAHRVCDSLAEGLGPRDIRRVLMDKGLTLAESSRLMLAAAKVYCPDYEKTVNP